LSGFSQDLLTNANGNNGNAYGTQNGNGGGNGQGNNGNGNGNGGSNNNGGSSTVVTPVTDSQAINLTAHLKTTIALDLDKSDITFDFVTLNDYQKGLGGLDGSYASAGAVSCTSNWNLSARATGDFKHTDGTTTIPLNNVGLSVRFKGTNPIQNNTTSAPLPLSTTQATLIGYNGSNSNAGDFDVNSFTVYWEMGTGKGNMNHQSLFAQDLKKGTYSTQVEFVASEVIK
ncbi:MAG: hypothetical protein Q8862_06150, partial [Bacteroidota bacterium]|nr:hypothetical protein [Bacteroidota bacterium]